MATDVKKSDYDESKIKVLEGVEHVRQRPAMYIGSVGEAGLHHLINEVVDNSIDEALAGFCTEISVTLHDDGSCTVIDNGRGIPTGMHEKLGRPAVEVVLTKTNAGGKFDKGAYKVSGGLHGVGVSCVNALSRYLEVEVHREGKIHKQSYERAVPTYDLKVTGKTDKTGTRITFYPDAEIFRETTVFKFSIVSRRLRELAYLNPGLKIIAKREGEDEIEEVYHYKEGLKAFVTYLAADDETLLPEPVVIRGELDSPESGGRVEVELAVQYTTGYSEVMRSYVNDIHTVDGGTHVTGFKQAFTAAFNNYLLRKDSDKATKKSRKGKSKASKQPSGDAYREGLVAVISLKIPDPQFAGQNKMKLGNTDVRGLVQQIVGDALSTWIEENPNPASLVLNKAMEAQRVRDAVRKARDLARSSGKALKGPKKLATCTSKKPEEREIFLVEGDSAGGSARQGRDSKTQAILPLRGKILNVWKATPDKMLGHEEIKAIVSALGTGILEEFDAEACRYHKIVIMCDADVDGQHIRTLLLTFLFQHMPQLIDKGFVYLACPPLYGVKQKGRKGLEYIIDESAFRKKMHRSGIDDTVLHIEGEERTITGDELVALKSLIDDFVAQDKLLRGRGLSLEEFWEMRNPEGVLPFSLLTTEIGGVEQTLRTYSEEEHLAFIAQLEEAKRGELKIWRENTEDANFAERVAADLIVNPFKGIRIKVADYFERLDALGFSSDQFFGTGAGRVSDLQLLDEDFDLVRAMQTEVAAFRLTNPVTKAEFEFDALFELSTMLVEMGKHGITVKRYKGLGEMNADELWDTTMDPTRRTLKQVQIEDFAADKQIFNCLMGSKVEPRKEFIIRYSKEIELKDLSV